MKKYHTYHDFRKNLEAVQAVILCHEIAEEEALMNLVKALWDVEWSNEPLHEDLVDCAHYMAVHDFGYL